MAKNLTVAIDIGSSQTRIGVALLLPEGKLKILAVAKSQTHGVRYGHIVNSNEAGASLVEAVRKAELATGLKIKRASVAINGVALATTTLSSSVAISRADGEITDLDLERALSESEAKLTEQANTRVIHAIPTDFKVDGKRIIGKPHGMHAGKLEVKTLFVTVANAHLKKLVKVVESAGIEVEDVFAGPIAESLVSASNVQKNAGCVIANIGSATTSIILYEENLPKSLAVFKIGGDDITHDIALGLKIPIEEAELIKVGEATGNATKTFSRKIDDITEARLGDMFELIDGHLKKVHRSGLLPAGIIITGGGSYIERITDYAKKYLNLPASLGYGTEKKLISPSQDFEKAQKELMQARLNFDAIREPVWASIYGLLVLSSQLEDEDSAPVRFIKTTKNHLVRWFRQFLP